MAEIVQKLEQLTSLDNAQHWFCPSSDSDHGSYFEEDCGAPDPQESEEQRAARQKKVKEARVRINDAMGACKILAFDGDDAIAYQSQLKQGLQTQLSRCDVCVREFHRSRALLLAILEADYLPEEIRAFMDKFDDMNNARIVAGLKEMLDTLLRLPAEKRNIQAAGDTGTFALFEALNCLPFLQNEELLEKSFDPPFRLVQSNKKLRLPNFAPGMISFLFSDARERNEWALRNVSQIKRQISPNEFDHSVKPFLDIAMRKVNIMSLQVDFLPLFWRATRLITLKLTKTLITNHLRAMDTNLFALSLEHFQIDGSHFADESACYQALLEVSPGDFWDAMGSVSPQGILEIMFQSPMLARMLVGIKDEEKSQFENQMSWACTFINKIKPANLLPPLRFLLDQLLHRFQQPKYDPSARQVLWVIGLKCLLEAVKLVAAAVDGGPIYFQMIDAVAKDHLSTILQELDGIEKKGELQIDRTQQIDLDILEHILRLDIKGLVRDRRFIFNNKELDHDITISSSDLWTTILGHIRAGHPSFVIAILSGITGLATLEEFAPVQLKSAGQHAEKWNMRLNTVLGHISSDLCERLETFHPDQLDELLTDHKAAKGIAILLLSGDTKLHQSALSILKTLSGADSRRDSMMHIIRNYPGTTLSAVSFSLAKIAEAQAFSPCSVLLKVCTDIYGCLCDSQDGFLRSQKQSGEWNSGTLLDFWQKSWMTLDMIFAKAEFWSKIGHDKSMMQDFCRETMDFADFTFNQYSMFASTLGAAKGADEAKIGKELLNHPRKAFKSIIGWLRLRDDYLIAIAVGLTTKILNRLQNVGAMVDDLSAKYLEDVVITSSGSVKIKTKLTLNQKAELRRALENHLGRTIGREDSSPDAEPAKAKQGSLESWAFSGGRTSSPSSETIKSRPRGTLDVNAWSDAAKRQIGQHVSQKSSLTPKDEDAKRKLGLKQTVGASATTMSKKTAQQKQDFLQSRQKAKADLEKQRQAFAQKANAGMGAGSGVNGLGNIGADHSTKGQEIMVSSGEESDDDDDGDDDVDDDIFGTKSKEKRKIKMPIIDVADAVGLRPEQKKGPTRIQRTARSMKDMRARLAPDLSALHQKILSWDFFYNGDFPPNTNPEQFSRVANAFRDPVSYQQTFEPLLTLEAWQGMIKAREESSAKPFEIKVQSRSNVDSFIEISSIIGHAENKETQLQEGDIVLCSKARKPLEDSSAPHCLARIYRIKRQKQHLEIVYQIMPSAALSSHLGIQSVVHGLKVQSITPLEREYGALKALQYYDLCNQIVQAKPSRRIHASDKHIEALQDVYNVNRAQAEAIDAALENEGFSLIQGPPGSGKTKTIVAIVGGLLSSTLANSNKGATRITIPKTNGNQNATGDAPSKKLLVCAPSNAAVDELVMRLKDGVKLKNGALHKLEVVRIGRSDAINTQVLDVTMDELVAKRLGNTDADGKARAKTTELFKDHEQVSARLRELYQKRDGGEVKGNELSELENDIREVRKRKNDLSERIDGVKDQERNAERDAGMNRKRAQQAVLDGAHVICATLSGSGHDMFQSLNIEFETVIIDEAAQCVEMSSLIPLKYGCVKCVMVGDPKQLPPTVFSKEAARFQYEQSLFVRMQNNHADEVHLLDTQYRMHPDISLFPSRTFYDGLLKDGPGMAGSRKQPWHSSALLAPYRFYDVQGQHQAAPKGHSLINVAEIDIALALYNRLTSDFKNYDFQGKVGIITPYKSQLAALKSRFSTRYGNTIFDTIEFNTTDAFQGRESEVIIFSCVRASPSGGIGFLQDIRRMNVGLTRAKSSLWVLGNSQSLVKGQYWKKLVEDAQARDCYSTGDIKAMLQKPSSAFPSSSERDTSMYDAPWPGSHAAEAAQNDSHESTHGAETGSCTADKSDTKPSADGTARSTVPDVDKMEGVRYRFEDRARKSHGASSSRTSHEQPAAAPLQAIQDVEMEDADHSSRSSTPSSRAMAVDPARSRSNTPMAAAVRGQAASEAVEGGHVHSTKAPPTATAQHVVRKKRPAATPFMPKKPRH